MDKLDICTMYIYVCLRGPLYCCQPNVFLLHPHKKHKISLITSGDAEKEKKRLRRH
jgi:hypothetical protein